MKPYQTQPLCWWRRGEIGGSSQGRDLRMTINDCGFLAHVVSGSTVLLEEHLFDFLTLKLTLTRTC